MGDSLGVEHGQVHIFCHICGKSTLEAESLLRISAKGVVPGVWACMKHHDRCSCAVAFCSNSMKGAYWWVWICGEHWRMVPKRMKAPFFRIRRRANARNPDEKHWSPDEQVRVERLLRRMAHYVSVKLLGEFFD